MRRLKVYIPLLLLFCVLGTAVGQATPAPTAKSGSNAKGKAAVAKLVAAMGGEAKVAAVKTLNQHLTTKQEGVDMKINLRNVYPDKQVQSILYPLGVVWQVVTPTDAFLTMGPKVHELTPAQRASISGLLKRDFLNVLQHTDDPKYTFSASGTEKLGNTEATVVDVNADGVATRWWIGADGTLLQEQHDEAGEPSPTTLTTKYSIWKSFDGLNYPTKLELFADGVEQSTTILDDMKVNPTVDPKLFERPQH